MDKEIAIEFNTFDNNSIITRKYFQSNNINLDKINVCYQGITYLDNTMTREKLRAKRMKDIYPEMNERERLHHKLLRIKTLSQQSNDLFYQFHSFDNSISPKFIHSQLRQNFIFVSPNEFTFLTLEGIFLYNMISKESNSLINFDSSDIDIDKSIISFDVYKYSRRDYLIALGKANSILKIIRLNDSQLISINTLEIIPDDENLINSVKFTYESTMIITSDNTGHICLINTSTVQIVSIIIYEEAINDFSYDNHLNLIAAVGDFNEVLLYNSKSSKLISKMKGHKDHGMVAKFNNDYDGYLLGTGNQDIECRLWDMRKISNSHHKDISFKTLYGYTNSIGNLDFLSNNRLVYYENTDYFHIYDINNDTMQSIGFFGEVTGSAVNREKEHICIGIMFPDSDGLSVYEKISSYLIHNTYDL